jgi:hypothetical protein
MSADRREHLGVVQGETADRGHHLGAVDERDRLLRRELDGLQVSALQRLGAGEPLPLEHRLALADEDERGVRERREVTGGPDAPVHRDDRMDAAVEKVEEEVDGLGPHAGAPGGEGVRAQEEDRPGDVCRQRVADARGVAAQEVVLELHQVRARDPLPGEVAEAGVHAVDRGLALGELGDELRRRAHELLGRAVQGHRRVVPGDGHDVRDGEARAVDAERGHRSSVRCSRYHVPSAT